MTVSNLTNTNHDLDGEYENLSFRQALYDFPNAEIAILDEDGDIIAANPLWLESGANGGPDHDKTPALGTNYFDVCRRTFDNSGATALIQQLKQIIAGQQSNYLMEYAVVEGQQEYGCNLMAFCLNDNPNSLMLVHEKNVKRSPSRGALRPDPIAVPPLQPIK